jgi:hypothetical protein
MLIRGAGFRQSARGLRERPHRWTEAEIVCELRRLCSANVTPTYEELTAAGHLSLVRAIQNFGGMQKLRRLSGLPRPRAKSRQPALERDAVLAEIGRRHEAGEALAWSTIPMRLRNGGVSHFGSWLNAVAAAGIDYEQVRMRPRPRPEIADLSSA